MTIGQSIKHFRLEKLPKLKQYQVAEKMGMTASTLSRIEAGTLNISVSRLEEIAKVLGVEVRLIKDGNGKALQKVGILTTNANAENEC